MKATEIKALRKAETIEQIAAMVDCRDFEHGRDEWVSHIKVHLQAEYIHRVFNGLPEAAALNYAKANLINANGGTVKQQSEFWRAARAAMTH